MLFTGVDKPVENYKRVIKGRLAPTGSEGETHADEGKAHNHVPGADIRDRILGLRDVEDDDPEEANQEGRNHGRSEPTWALKLYMGRLRRKEVRAVIFLLLT